MFVAVTGGVALAEQPIQPRNHSLDSLPGADNSVSVFHETFTPNHVRGGRIYDDFIIEREYVPTAENVLLQFATPTDPSMPTPSLEDGWRCSYCHGYDYAGGRLTFSNNVTPNLFESREIKKFNEDYVINILMFGFNMFDGVSHRPVHEYALKLSIQDMVDVADFIVNEIYDARKYIRDSSNESVLNHMPSMYIYKGAEDLVLNPDPLAARINGVNFTCTACHGPLGRQVPGIDLYVLAWTDPYKWMHRVNFGTPRSQRIFPNLMTEDMTIHPGVYEVVLIKELHFGRSRNTAELLEYVQTHFKP